MELGGVARQVGLALGRTGSLQQLRACRHRVPASDPDVMSGRRRRQPTGLLAASGTETPPRRIIGHPLGFRFRHLAPFTAGSPNAPGFASTALSPRTPFEVAALHPAQRSCPSLTVLSWRSCDRRRPRSEPTPGPTSSRRRSATPASATGSGRCAASTTPHTSTASSPPGSPPPSPAASASATAPYHGRAPPRCRQDPRPSAILNNPSNVQVLCPERHALKSADARARRHGLR